MTEKNYDALKLENQLCFPLYACAKEIVRRYKPHLDKLDLTYTQYIAMMVVWEHQKITVKDMGKKLFLDSGTLTPVLKTLETKGYIKRERMASDERNLQISLTSRGERLREEALFVPEEMAGCVHIPAQDAASLYAILYKILGSFAPGD